VRLVLVPAAVIDIRTATDYYEAARPGLSEDLAGDLDRLFARLEAFPRSARVVAGYEDVRRAQLRRFPYAVFYRLVEPDLIVVLRVIHTARSSDSWPG
jgi:toxin ParE1/3/4